MKLITPTVVSTLRLASGRVPWAVARDVNGDGVHELIIPASDRIGAWSLDGLCLWTYPMSSASYIHCSDLDGDGRPEVVLIQDGLNEIVVLDGVAGTLKYRIELAEGTKVYNYNMHFGRYVPSRPGEQMAFATNGPVFGTAAGAQLNTYVYAFDAARGAATLEWKATIDESTPEKVRFVNWAASVEGDVDNDGRPELVTFVYDGFIIQDVSNGRVKQSYVETVGQGRNYGTFEISDVDGDGKNELVLLDDLLSLHLEVFRCTTDNATCLWERVFDGPWPVGKTFIHIPGASPLGRMSGDGSSQLVFSEWTAENGWVTHICDAATGRTRQSIAGAYAIWLGDLDNDGVDELLVSYEAKHLPQSFASWSIYSYQDFVLTLRFNLEAARLECRVGYPISEPIEYKAGLKGRSQDAREPLMVDWDGDGFLEIFFKTAKAQGGWFVVGYDGSRFVTKRTIPNQSVADERIIAALPHSVRNPAAVVIASAGGFVDRVDSTGKLFPPITVREAYDYRYLIADVDGAGRNVILVEDADGVKAIDLHESGDSIIRWCRPGQLLGCADVDGHGGKRVIIARSSGTRVSIIALRGDAEQQWETALERLSASPLIERAVHSVAVGRFSGRPHDDIYVSGGLTVPTGNGNADRSWMLSGDTGAVKWFNDASDPKFPLPSIGPSRLNDAVAVDVTGDGADDILMVSQIWVTALRGRTGQLLFKPVELMHALQNGTTAPYQWSGYAALSLLRADPGGSVYLLAHNSTGAWGTLELRSSTGDIRGLWGETPSLRMRTYVSICDADKRDGVEVVAADGSVKIFDVWTGMLKYDVKDVTGARFVSTVSKTWSGKADVVVVSENRLHVLDTSDGAPRKVFTYSSETPLNAPILGDVDSDGCSEIVVVTTAGELLVFGQKRRFRRALAKRLQVKEKRRRDRRTKLGTSVQDEPRQ